ncbi:folylpolyglutamate synthase/dihydrofolate synthase family protein [uncultured Rothia sp.]|uniref:bifunctional folylpolyglutamate synthase/dihydrofolate synthase n=1 Tax=uncultured Rothia sp. TaxID=316088 RepID=UPI0028D8B189|nr:folylpolyglutamate synthase/dihydrofolate synthase family protein [uncultured Rothia sp.]
MSEKNYPAIPDPEGVERVYGELLARAPENKMAPRLDAVARAVEILGDVHRAAPVIHITGTNGKTSTARMIEALLLGHDLRVGRFTSPHLESVTERICINGAPVPDATFVRIWEEIAPYLQIVDAEMTSRGEPALTFFESITVLAFAIFADEPVDVVVLEVGIGGTWDSTNVADGVVSVVTPIGLDHTDMLGETLAEIATEKSGIIKPGGFLVSAVQEPEAADVLLASAREKEASFAFEGVEFGVVSRELAVGGQLLTLRGLAGEYPDVPLSLHGAHQAQNAVVALAAVEAFFGGQRQLPEDVVRAAFESVRSPGRLEVVRTEPLTILDAGHNPHGVRASAAALTEAFKLSHLHAVVGILGEKDALGMFETMREEYVDASDGTFRLYLSASDSPRAIAPERLHELALDAGIDEDSIEVFEHLDEAIATAMENALFEQESAGVLITGSITVIGEARTLLAKHAEAKTPGAEAEELPDELPAEAGLYAGSAGAASAATLAAAAAAASEAEPDELLNDIMAELGGESAAGSSLEDSLGLPLGDSYTEDFFGDEDSEED